MGGSNWSAVVIGAAFSAAVWWVAVFGPLE
jgi:hypothetical protein